jgi:hypothetical protein
MSDQLVAEAGNDTTHNKHNRQTSMPSAGFEPSLPAIKRLQNHILDRTETGIILHNILLTCLRRQMRRIIWDRDCTNGFSSRQILFSFRINSEEVFGPNSNWNCKMSDLFARFRYWWQISVPKTEECCARNPFWVRGTWNAVGRTAETASLNLPKRRKRELRSALEPVWATVKCLIFQRYAF